MKHFFILICLTLDQISMAAESVNIKPFTTDGCSLFPDGTLKDNTLWKSCCIEHDKAYWRGGSYPERQAADHAGIMGIDIESRGARATTFLNLHLRGQLMWDPEADVDAMIDGRPSVALRLLRDRREVEVEFQPLRRAAGAILAYTGISLEVIDVTDFWTFSRDTRSSDPNWTLIGTESNN